MSRDHTPACVRCGNNSRPAARRPDGVICYQCYYKDNLEPCGQCGKVRPPNTCDTGHFRAPYDPFALDLVRAALDPDAVPLAHCEFVPIGAGIPEVVVDSNR